MERVKERVKSLIRMVAKYDAVWDIVQPFVQIAIRFSTEREYWLPGKIEEAGHRLKPRFADMKVMSGPFKGMLYPEFLAHGSSLYPKLIGSYELELHPVIENVCSRSYTEILDIGCAEGYYAVGLAQRLPEARVFAYDIDGQALASCQRMAALNGVLGRMSFEGYCDSQVLRHFNFKHRGLVICDCEGYELELFNKASVGNLGNCDLLIELHDFLQGGITEKILEVFSQTHSAALISVEPRNIGAYPVLRGLDRFTKRFALNEGRPHTMHWAYLESKTDGVCAR